MSHRFRDHGGSREPVRESWAREVDLGRAMTSLKGNLNSVDLANIFQMLSLNQREGTLYIFEGNSRKAIYFGHDGVSMLSRGRNKPDTLGRILVRSDRITPEQLEEALQRQEQDQGGRMLGQVLVEQGLVTRADVEEALQIQIEEEVYSLFIWKDAQFEFIEGEPDEEFRGADGVTKLTFNVNSLIMEAARRVDEWEWIQSVVQDPQEIYRYTGRNVDLADPIFQEPCAGKVLAAIDGKRSVDEVISASYVNRFEVSKVLALLVEGGAVERLPVPELRKEAETAVAAGDTEAAVKFLSRLVAVKGDTPEMHRQLAEAFEGDKALERAAFHYRVYAEIQVDAGNIPEAFRVYHRIVELLPTDLAAGDRLIEVFAINPDGLEEHAKEIIERGKQLADVYTELKRSSRAVQVLHRVVALGPDDPDLRNRLIQVYLACGMPGEAIAEYDALAETAIAMRDLEQAERIYRKILTIDRTRDDVLARLNQLVSRKKSRQRGVRNLIAAGVFAALAVGTGWYAWGFLRAKKEEAARAETQASANVARVHEMAAPVVREVHGFLEELVKNSHDLDQLAKVYKEQKPRREEVEKKANRSIQAYMQAIEQNPESAAAGDARRGADEISGALKALQDRDDAVTKALREEAERLNDQAFEQLQAGIPIRDVHAKLQRALMLTERCRGWLTTEKGQACNEFHNNLRDVLARFEAAKASVEDKVKRDLPKEAFDDALVFLTSLPGRELAADMPVPVRITSVPPGARVLEDGIDLGIETPAVVRISVPRGAKFDLELQGFETKRVAIAPVREGDPRELADKVQFEYVAKMQKGEVFRLDTSGRVDGRPAVADGLLIVPTRSNYVDVFDVATRTPKKPLDPRNPSGITLQPLVHGQGERAIVVVAALDKVVYFYDLRTSESVGKWDRAQGALRVDPVLAGDDVIVCDDKGWIYAVNVHSHSHERWKRIVQGVDSLPVAFTAAPVLHEGRIYTACGDGRVRVFDPKDGAPGPVYVVNESSRREVSMPVVIHEGSLYVVTADGPKQSRVTRVDLATGKVEWSQGLAGEAVSRAWIWEGTAFVATTDGDIVGFRMEGGTETTRYALRARILAEPVLDRGLLYVGDASGTFSALDVRGRAIAPSWQFDVKGREGKDARITSPPVLVGELVVFGADDKAVHALKR